MKELNLDDVVEMKGKGGIIMMITRRNFDLVKNINL